MAAAIHVTFSTFEYWTTSGREVIAGTPLNPDADPLVTSSVITERGWVVVAEQRSGTWNHGPIPAFT